MRTAQRLYGINFAFKTFSSHRSLLLSCSFPRFLPSFLPSSVVLPFCLGLFSFFAQHCGEPPPTFMLLVSFSLPAGSREYRAFLKQNPCTPLRYICVRRYTWRFNRVNANVPVALSTLVAKEYVTKCRDSRHFRARALLPYSLMPEVYPVLLFFFSFLFNSFYYFSFLGIDLLIPASFPGLALSASTPLASAHLVSLHIRGRVVKNSLVKTYRLGL